MPVPTTDPAADSSRLVQILLVEAAGGDALKVRDTLAGAGVANHLHVAEDAGKALAFLRRENGFETAPAVDVVLLDLNLPRKGGRELLAELKADPRLAHIPVAIVTGSDFEAEILEAYNLDVTCYITKPVDVSQLLKVVRSIPHFQIAIVTRRVAAVFHA